MAKALQRPASKAMPRRREKLFAFLAQDAAYAAEYYSLPANRGVEMGGQRNSAAGSSKSAPVREVIGDSAATDARN
jgi:hypothetical protein